MGYEMSKVLESLRGVFLCCWRICMVCLVLELVGPWVELGFSIGMGHLMSSYRLIFPGVRSSLVFSGFLLKTPASGFQLYSYSSLKTRIKKMRERFNKDLEEIKKSQYIMNNAINEIKKTLWKEPTVE